MRNDHFRLQGTPVFRYNDGMDSFAPMRIRNCNDRAFSHTLVLEDRVLDFAGINVLAARDDHILQAIDDEDESVLVHPGAVAGMQPSVAQRSRCLFRLAPVTEHYTASALCNLSTRPARQYAARIVE